MNQPAQSCQPLSYLTWKQVCMLYGRGEINRLAAYRELFRRSIPTDAIHAHLDQAVEQEFA